MEYAARRARIRSHVMPRPLDGDSGERLRARQRAGVARVNRPLGIVWVSGYDVNVHAVRGKETRELRVDLADAGSLGPEVRCDDDRGPSRGHSILRLSQTPDIDRTAGTVRRST